jgi:hypothetical protein
MCRSLSSGMPRCSNGPCPVSMNEELIPNCDIRRTSSFVHLRYSADGMPQSDELSLNGEPR